MKKTSLIALLMVLCLCLPMLVSCDIKFGGNTAESESQEMTEDNELEKETNVGTESQNTNYSEIYNDPVLIFEELASRGYTGTFEEWVESLTGKDGKSAYDLAVDNGYLGTVEEWLDSLVGAPGKDGADGEKGDKGDKGDTGRGIAKVEIISGEVVITYTDGTKENVGALVQNDGTNGLEYFPLPDGTYAVSAGTTKYLENIVIPAEYNGMAVTQIVPEAFKGSTNLKSITIPDSVTSIDWGAFCDCSSLTSIVFSENSQLTSIGSSAFECCSSLTSVKLPDSVTSIGYAAFRYCSSLTSITIPDSVTSIGEAAFSSCSSLENITIPNSVTSIRDSVFENCSSLSSITLPDNITKIGSFVFSGCTSLASITISNSVTIIDWAAFNDCTSLTTVNYTGTEEEWAKISIDDDNSYLTNATIIYNYVHEE